VKFDPIVPTVVLKRDAEAVICIRALRDRQLGQRGIDLLKRLADWKSPLFGGWQATAR
jgi:hypothetical protein